MNKEQWLLLGIILVFGSVIAGVIGAYFETKEQSRKNKNNKNDRDEH